MIERGARSDHPRIFHNMGFARTEASSSYEIALAGQSVISCASEAERDIQINP